MPYRSPSNHNAHWEASNVQHRASGSDRTRDDAQSRQRTHYETAYQSSSGWGGTPSSYRHSRHNDISMNHQASQRIPTNSNKSFDRRNEDDRPRLVGGHRPRSPQSNVTQQHASAYVNYPMQPTSRERKPASSGEELGPWSLCGALDAYVLPTPSDTLLLHDVRRRCLCASVELAQTLCSLEDPEWPERDFHGKVLGIVTVSKDGRWFALAVCKDERSARGIKTTIEDKVKDLAVEFVERETVVGPHGNASWTLHDDLLKVVASAGALVDGCDVLKLKRPGLRASRLDGTDDQLIQGVGNTRQKAGPSLLTDQQIVQMPGSVAKDHRKMASIPSSKKLAAHIGRWNAQQQQRSDDDVHEERHADASDDKIAIATPSTSDQTVSAEEFDYTDEEKQACLLCQRQFKSMQVLRKHTVESELHKRNLQDESTCKAGKIRKEATTMSLQSSQQSKMKRAGFAPVIEASNSKSFDATSPESAEAVGVAYRDRAMERRLVFGEETVITKAKPFTLKRNDSSSATAASREQHSYGNAQASASPPAASTVTPLDESSVGGALLAKMGWESGKGLGSSGEGRVAPVEAHVYTPGAGIGIGSSGNGGDGHRAAPVPTVEEYTAKRARLMLGDAATQRAERMRQRFEDR